MITVDSDFEYFSEASSLKDTLPTRSRFVAGVIWEGQNVILFKLVMPNILVLPLGKKRG